MDELLHEDIATNLCIYREWILLPCPSFPEGVMVGDRVKIIDTTNLPVMSTVVSRNEWEEVYDFKADFTDRDFLCSRDDTPIDGKRIYKNRWEYVTWIERPSKLREANGQLLMF